MPPSPEIPPSPDVPEQGFSLWGVMNCHVHTVEVTDPCLRIMCPYTHTPTKFVHTLEFMESWNALTQGLQV